MKLRGYLKIENLHVNSRTLEGKSGIVGFYNKGSRTPHLVMDFDSSFKIVTLPGFWGNGHTKFALKAGCFIKFDEATIYETGEIKLNLVQIVDDDFTGILKTYKRAVIKFPSSI